MKTASVEFKLIPAFVSVVMVYFAWPKYWCILVQEESFAQPPQHGKNVRRRNIDWIWIDKWQCPPEDSIALLGYMIYRI